MKSPELHEVISFSYQEPKDYNLLDAKTEKVRDVYDFRGQPRKWADYPGASKKDSSAERHLYYRIAMDLGPGNYADIGVWRGGSSAALANGLYEGKHKGIIYSVDFFGQEGSNGRDFGLPPDRLLNYVKDKGLDAYATIKICQGNSINIGRSLKDTVFNFVSIDGDHTYAGCKADCDIWSPLVKPGGLLAFNDIVCLSVDKVMKELDKSQWEYVRQIYNTKVFRRK